MKHYKACLPSPAVLENLHDLTWQHDLKNLTVTCRLVLESYRGSMLPEALKGYAWLIPYITDCPWVTMRIRLPENIKAEIEDSADFSGIKRAHFGGILLSQPMSELSRRIELAERAEHDS